jgi:hypothetical protein
MRLARVRAWRSVGLLVFLSPFVAISIAFFAFTAFHLVTALRLARHEPSAVAGPTRLSGRVGAPTTPARSPDGHEGAGWLAWVEEDGVDGDGAATHTLRCTRASLAGVPITGTTSAVLDWVTPADAVRPVFGTALTVAGLASTPRLKLADRKDEADGAVAAIPDAMRALCGAELAGRDATKLRYAEDVLAPGVSITIVACRAPGPDGHLRPCGDGVDAVGVGALEGRSAGESFLLPFGQVWTLLTVALLGLMARDRVVRLRGARPEGAS